MLDFLDTYLSFDDINLRNTICCLNDCKVIFQIEYSISIYVSNILLLLIQFLTYLLSMIQMLFLKDLLIK